MAELTIRVQKDGDVRSPNAMMTSVNEISDSMLKNWTFLDNQKMNPLLYGPDQFPYTPEQERMAEQAFADAFPQNKYPIPEGRDIGDYVFIGNQSLSEMYAQHQDAYDKLFPSKKSFMEMAVYAEALKRDKAISFVNPQAIQNDTGLNHDAIMTVQPAVTDVTKRGFFGSIWNRVKNFFGVAGSETAINNEYKSVHKRGPSSQREQDIANKFSINNIVKADEIQQGIARAQAERDGIQKSYITQAVQFSPENMHEDFFGDLKNEDFKKDNTSFGKILQRGTRMNVARLYMLSKGYSLDDIFSKDQKMVETRREIGKEFMDRVKTGDLNVHAEMCAEMLKPLLNDSLYPPMNLADDASIVNAYTKSRTIDNAFSFRSEVMYEADLREAVTAKLTPEESAAIQSKSESFMSVYAPISDRHRMIRSNYYSNVNDSLKDANYRREFYNPTDLDADNLRCADKLLGEYQQKMSDGKNISQIVADRGQEINHQREVFDQSRNELQAMTPEQRNKVMEELRNVKRDLSPSRERRDVTNEFVGNRQPQKLTENQKARSNPQKDRFIQPM